MKTITYVLLRAAVCLSALAVTAGLFLLLHTALSAAGDGPGTAGFIIWLVLTPFIFPFLKSFVFYRVKAGHLKAITEALATERLPLNLLAECDCAVRKSYPTPASCCEAEITAVKAVRQLYAVIDGNAKLYHGIMAQEWFIKCVRAFMAVYLTYISDCCLSYTYVNPDKSPDESLARGIAVFFRGWRQLLITAYRTASRLMITTAVMFILLTAGILTVTIVCAGFGFTQLVLSVVLGVIAAAGIKFAFIDPACEIKALRTFAEIADSTDESNDIYDKIADISPAFKKLWSRVDSEYAEKQAESASIIVNDEK